MSLGERIQTAKGVTSVRDFDYDKNLGYLAIGYNYIYNKNKYPSLGLFDVKIKKRFIGIKDVYKNIDKVLFSPNGKFILAGYENGNIKLFNTKSHKAIRDFKGHSNGIYNFKFNSDGKTIVSVGKERILKIWSLSTGKELISIVGFKEEYDTDKEWIAITPQGYFNASKNGAKYLNILTDPMTVTSIDAFYDKFYRPDIVKKALSGKTITQKDTLKNVIKNKLAPKVEILRVSESMSEDEKIRSTKSQYVYVTLKIDSKSGSVGDVRIQNNNIAIKTDSLRALFPKHKKSFKHKKYKVYLKKGINNITVSVTNRDNSMRSSIVSYKVEAKLHKAQSKNLHAVIVGIDSFTDSRNNLKFTVKDAKAFATLLKKTASKTYDNVSIKLLTSKEETSKENIKKVLKSYSKKVNTNDTFIFYGATHGTVDELDGSYYFITSDYDGDLKNSIDRQTLVKLLSNVKMQNKLIILDTCYSTEGSEDMITDLVNPSLQKIAKSGISIFAGSGTQQEALDGYKGHGLFTYTLLKGLRSIKSIGNKDRIITVSEPGSFVENQVPLYAEKINFIQTPLFEKSGENFKIGGE
ncbi:MAG: caspase family protein [Sulfurimonas sp.]|nr:caspase family protein [Sulfurimonas sp.]